MLRTADEVREKRKAGVASCGGILAASGKGIERGCRTAHLANRGGGTSEEKH